MKLTLSLISIIFVSILCTSCQTNFKETAIKGSSSNTTIISIAKDGTISLGSDKIAVNDLLSKLNSKGVKKSDTIILKTDRKTRYDAIVKVLKQLSTAGYSVYFSTNENKL